MEESPASGVDGNAVSVIVMCQSFPRSMNEPMVSGMVKNPFYQTLAVAPFLRRAVVLTTGLSKFKTSFAGIPVQSVGSSRLKGVFAAFEYEIKLSFLAIRLSRKTHFDLIHIHNLNLPILGILHKIGLFGPKIIYTAHGTSSPELSAARQGTRFNHTLLKVNGLAQHVLDILCWKMADQLVSPSAYQVAEMIRLYRVKKIPIEVIYNGVDHNRYHPVPDAVRSYNRGELGLSTEDMVVLFVGRAAKKKGADRLIRCADKLRDLFPHLKLILIVGYIGRQKPFRDELRQLSNNRTFVRYLENIPEEDLPIFYSSADLCVFPSIGYESIPTVIFEAMASGVPVLTQEAWGIPEVLNGHYISEEQILRSSFDDALVTLLSSPSQLRAMGDANFAKSAKFSHENGGRALNDLYLRVARRH